MIFTLVQVLALASQCAPSVAPETLLSVARTESGFNSLAIGVNGGSKGSRQPASLPEAVAVASRLIDSGRSVDLGVAQINSTNLRWLGLTVEQAFDPCRNLTAAARILQANYTSALPTSGSEQAALRTALSLYNTGDRSRGFRNGYVSRVEASAAEVVPDLRGMAAPTAPAPDFIPPAWDVFGAAQPASFVIKPTSTTTGVDR